MNTKAKYGTSELEKELGAVTFARLLKNVRESENWLQKDFAKKLKISPQRLNDFEKGRRLPDIETAVRFARILKDSEAFFVQILFQDYLRKEKLLLDVQVMRRGA